MAILCEVAPTAPSKKESQQAMIPLRGMAAHSKILKLDYSIIFFAFSGSLQKGKPRSCSGQVSIIGIWQLMFFTSKYSVLKSKYIFLPLNVTRSKVWDCCTNVYVILNLALNNEVLFRNSPLFST